MKFSKIAEWFGENIGNIIGITLMLSVVVVCIGGIVYSSPDSRHMAFREGTEVIVKGTTISGTVTGWKEDGTTVIISSVQKDGTVKTFEYNYNLLKRQ